MINIVTGYNGFLGNLLTSNLNNSDTVNLKYNRYTKDLYPDLNSFKNKKSQIIHCGASADRKKISRNTYKDNWSSLKELITFTENNDSRIIYISANSISVAGCESKVTDLYSHLKNEGEMLIKKTLPLSKYAIIRLPGLYEKQTKRSGFLDQLFYNDQNISQRYLIRANNMFNNLMTIEDAVDFICKIANQDILPGYIGSCGTYTHASMLEICQVLIKFKSSIKVNIEFDYNEGRQNSTAYNIDKALKYGLIRRDIDERLHHLYKS